MKKHILLFTVLLCLGTNFSQCMDQEQPDIKNVVQLICSTKMGLISDAYYFEKIENQLDSCENMQKEAVQRSVVKALLESDGAFKNYISRSCDSQFHMTPDDIYCHCDIKSHEDYPKVDIAESKARSCSGADLHRLYGFLEHNISLKHLISIYFLYNWRKDHGEPLDVTGYPNIYADLRELARIPSRICPTDFKNFVFKTLIA